jgi:hypothetical protein
VSTDRAATGRGAKKQARKTIAEKARIFEYLAGMTAVSWWIRSEGIKRAGGDGDETKDKLG